MVTLFECKQCGEKRAKITRTKNNKAFFECDGCGESYWESIVPTKEVRPTVAKSSTATSPAVPINVGTPSEAAPNVYELSPSVIEASKSGESESFRGLKHTVQELLPECWLPVEACLSLIASRMIIDVDHCLGLILVAPSSGSKGTTFDILGYDSPIAKRSSFTPASLVSHDTSKSEAQLKKIDLLPQIAGMILLWPEMATFFDMRRDDLAINIARLTEAMDGNGLAIHSGSHGLREYRGKKYRFNMIGGTTPIPHSAWQTLGKLGSRWVFYHFPQPERTLESETAKLRGNFPARKEEAHQHTAEFIHNLWTGMDSIEWDREADNEIWHMYVALSAMAMVKWRAMARTQDTTGYNPVDEEATNRLRESVYALARGHALIRGNTQVDFDDILFAHDINSTNMPTDRHLIYQAYTKLGEEPELSLQDVKQALHTENYDVAHRVMRNLVDIKVVKEITHGRSSRPYWLRVEGF